MANAELFADISGHQVTVDLRTYANAGHKVIALKATEGDDFKSDAFVERWEKAAALGLTRGAYHFARPSKNTPEAEAWWFLAWVRQHGLRRSDLLILDWEDEGFTRNGDEWVERFKKASGCHILYSYGPYMQRTLKGVHGLAYWHAAHIQDPTSTVPAYARQSLVAVQYTNGQDGGQPRSAQGIGACDMNRLYVPLFQFQALAQESVPDTPEEAPVAGRIPSVEWQQARMNWFVKKYKLGYAPLIKDGDRGPATKRRTKEIRFYLGQGLTIGQLRSEWTVGLTHRTAHPNNRRYPAKERLRGAQRRLKRRAAVRRQQALSIFARGVTTYDGKPVARWLVPYLKWARENGWRGQLNSGYRTPAYSESLCRAMCGAPTCPGRCAGRASNHSGSAPPQGAVDVSDYARFGQLMARCPHRPHIFNALGARDPVHFSRSGR